MGKLIVRLRLLLAFFFLSLVLPHSVLAQSHVLKKPYNPSFYMGIGAIFPDINSGIDSPTGATEIKRSNAGFRIYGGYLINKYFAIEANYADYGTDRIDSQNIGDSFTFLGRQYNFAGAANGSVSANSIGVGPVISLNTSYVRPFFKIGYHWWNYDLDISNVLINGVASKLARKKQGGDIYWGLGLDFKLYPQFWLRMEYISTPIDGRSASQSGINIMGLF